VALGHELGAGSIILVNLSGRGDKDVDTAARWFQVIDDAALDAPAPNPQQGPGSGAGEQL